MTDTVDTEKKERKAAKKIFLFELVDNDGNVIENASFENNVRVVAEFKKIDESVIDLVKDHPAAFFAKL